MSHATVAVTMSGTLSGMWASQLAAVVPPGHTMMGNAMNCTPYMPYHCDSHCHGDLWIRCASDKLLQSKVPMVTLFCDTTIESTDSILSI